MTDYKVKLEVFEGLRALRMVLPIKGANFPGRG
jgi:hypothetical protein